MKGYLPPTGRRSQPPLAGSVPLARVHAVIHQQLSAKAAAAIPRRFRALFCNRALRSTAPL